MSTDSTNVSPERCVRGGLEAPLETIGGLGCWLPLLSPLSGVSEGGARGPPHGRWEGGLLVWCWCGLS